RLHAQVHFCLDRRLEEPHHLDRLKASQAWLRALNQIGEVVEKLHVSLEGSFYPRPQNLDGHFPRRRVRIFLAGEGEVDLGDGGGRNRLLVELGKELVQRPAKLALDRRLSILEVKGREAVLQVGKIERHLLADQIGTSRQKLPELDEAGAEFRQRIGQLLAGAAFPAAP